MIDLKYYGIYRIGLTSEEIQGYLRDRAKWGKYKKYSTKQLNNKFYKIAGINTQGSVTINGIFIGLMYRHDVERFADVLFDNKPTYFD